MPPRAPLPVDDLYARLGVPVDASSEAIEVAWRGLLRIHHPDIAGPAALELAKRINVAHDWLSDPALRQRYDTERAIGTGRRGRPRDGGPVGWEGAARRRVERAPTTAERVASVAARVAHLTGDELDRLALAEPAPIAFLATLRRFATPEAQAVLDDAERAAIAGLPAAVRRRPAVRDAVVGRLAEIVLGDALDELLGESGGDRARERLTRGWDSAVGQPRYGPATAAMDTLLGTLRALDRRAVATLATSGARERLGEPPWPAAASPEEDDVLRVSSELAGADAAAAVPSPDGDRLAPPGARRAAARIAHLLVLRHAFPTAEFDRLAAPWLGGLVPRAAPWRSRGPRSR
jgi:curved DNA-binding protein CbpA